VIGIVYKIKQRLCRMFWKWANFLVA